MKRLLMLAASVSLLAGAANAAPADVEVTLNVPPICSITNGPDELLPLGNATLNADTGALVGAGLYGETKMFIVCNVAGSFIEMTAEPLSAENPTTNTGQFTNNIGYWANLIGGGEDDPDGDSIEMQANPVSTSSAAANATGDNEYGRHIGNLLLTVDQFESGGKAVVSGGYSGEISITLSVL